MAIHVLDKHTAELIAAGEVVERPSSVVKELCENAIDAGATSVSVEIERGGIRLIRIQDNGSGILPEDIPLAFLRHATSKVQTSQDLEAIYTLGFRGEALASIASVAQVELLSKTDEEEHASSYVIQGGEGGELEAAARPRGTTISVNNLFYNTPARMKFLKKDSSEGNYVTETVTRLALSKPDIAFRYIRDGKLVFQTPGDGSLQSTVYAVLGAAFARDLVELEYEGEASGPKVYGLVTQPRLGRASRAMQFFFVNGRFVKNRTMMAALEQAYRGMAMQGRFPGCVLFLDLPAERVDVNVHPAKTEVRFANEKEVFDSVYRAAKATVMEAANIHGELTFAAAEQAKRQESTPAFSFTPAVEQQKLYPTPQPQEGITEQKEAEPVTRIQAYNNMADTLASDNSFVPYKTDNSPVYEMPKTEARFLDVPFPKEPLQSQRDQVKEVDEEEKKDVLPPIGADELQVTLAGQDKKPLRLIGEVFNTYILAEYDDKLCVIDKHAGHERILYEKLNAKRQNPSAQQLLAPITVALSAEEKNALLQNTDALAEVGIEAEDFGSNDVLVRSVPSDIEPASISDLVIEVAGRLVDNPKDTTDEKTQWVLHSISCRSAIKAGDHTPLPQLLSLAEQIISGEIPPFCPHGRPVILELSRKELEKQFGRLG